MKFSSNRCFIISFFGLLGLIFLMLTAGCNKVTKQTDNIEAPEVISEMNQRGIIEHPKEWHALMKQTDYGKKIKTVSELNQALQQGNPHSFATDSPQQLEKINFPSVSKINGYLVLNVPTFFSADSHKQKKYQNKLRELLATVNHQNIIILNFAHNEGGDYYPMLAGLSDIIPRGVLWSEVNNVGHVKKVVMTDVRVHGGLGENSYRYSASHNPINKKIIVIIDSRTGSAAEMTVMALKRNPKVTTVGVPSAGYTSVNTGRVSKSKKSAAIITIGTITSSVKIGSQQHFNNEPIRPDVPTVYAPISAAYGEKYLKQQPLDADFWSELKVQLSK